MEQLNSMQVFIDTEPEYGRYKVYVVRRTAERLWLLDCVGDSAWREIPNTHEAECVEERVQPSFWVPWDYMQALFDAIAAKGLKPKTLEAELAATKRHLDDALKVRDRILGLLELQPTSQTLGIEGNNEI